MRTAGILLAGGQSSRFGSPKAFAEWEGKPFYEISLDALRGVTDEWVIVSRPEHTGRFPETLRVITDIEEFAGEGPVAGILSGMEAVDADRYVVLPCDMPFIQAGVLKKLLDNHKTSATAVIADGKCHPLVSVWDASVKEDLRAALSAGKRRVMAVQEQNDVQWIEGNRLTDTPETVFMNVNRPDILRKELREDATDSRHAGPSDS